MICPNLICRVTSIQRFMNNNEKNQYAEIFKHHLQAGRPIFNSDKTDILRLEDGEIFDQCYADTPRRYQLPKYWFVSNKTRLVSVESGEPVWLKNNERANGSICYKFMITRDDGSVQIKNIEAHNLIGLVFGSETYGRAGELLDKEGVFSYGPKQKGVLKNNGHHKDQDHSNNDPDNIQFVTTDIHTLMDSAPSPYADEEKQIRFMQKLGELASQEEPNKITVFFDGFEYDEEAAEFVKGKKKSIHATNKVTLSPRAFAEMMVCLANLKPVEEPCQE